MIKIEFPADDKQAATAFGRALLSLGGAYDEAVLTPPAKVPALTVEQETEYDSDVARTDHIEAKIPASEGGTKNDNKVDILGVAFNAELCGKAKDPFYGSGKRKGQWKKRVGVDDATYDVWYASQLEQGAAQETADEVVKDTAAAFSKAEPEATVEPETAAPTDCGAFMGWVSNKQAAGALTQEDIGQAYVNAGVGVTDLFPPNDDATVQANVARLYAELSAKAGA